MNFMINFCYCCYKNPKANKKICPDQIEIIHVLAILYFIKAFIKTIKAFIKNKKINFKNKPDLARV